GAGVTATRDGRKIINAAEQFQAGESLEKTQTESRAANAAARTGETDRVGWKSVDGLLGDGLAENLASLAQELQFRLVQAVGKHAFRHRLAGCARLGVGGCAHEGGCSGPFRRQEMALIAGARNHNTR